jgi:hypothetical protein
MSNYRIQSHANVVLKPASDSHIVMSGEMDLGDTYNQSLKKLHALDLTGVTGGTNQIYYDGSAFSVAPVAAELVGSTGVVIADGAVSVDDSYVAPKSWVTSEISTAVSGLADAADVTTVANDLTAVNTRLTTVEGAYLASADASNMFSTIATVNNLDGRVQILEGATSSYALGTDLNALDTRVVALETDSTSYLTSSDLTGLAANDSLAVNVTNASCRQYVYKKDCLSGASESVFNIALDNEACYISVECCIEGSVKSGVVFCERSFSQISTADAVERTANDRFLGDILGDEVQFSITAKSVYCNLVGNVTTGNMKAVLFVKIVKRVIS